MMTKEELSLYTTEERELYLKEKARLEIEQSEDLQVVSNDRACELLSCKYQGLYKWRQQYLGGAKILTLKDIKTIIKARKVA